MTLTRTTVIDLVKPRTSYRTGEGFFVPVVGGEERNKIMSGGSTSGAPAGNAAAASPGSAPAADTAKQAGQDAAKQAPAASQAPAADAKQSNDVVAGERAAREAAEKALAEAQAKLQAIEDKGKSELQLANERAARAEQKLAEANLTVLRNEVVAAKGLPAGAAVRLQGATRTELEADAEALKALLAPQAPVGLALPQAGGTVQATGDDTARAFFGI